MCVCERERICACVDGYTPICTHIGCMGCGCVLMRVYKYESSVYRTECVCVFPCVCMYVYAHTYIKTYDLYVQICAYLGRRIIDMCIVHL